MHTPRTLLQHARTYLTDRGVDSPRLDAELLMAHVLGCDRTHLYMDLDRPLSTEEVDAFRALLRRRGHREPLAYITGSRGFWTLDLEVDARVLVPRPETELLVEAALKGLAHDPDAAWRIVDVGTGSGALALALASEFPHAQVLAIDLSTDALEVARANADRLGLRDRVRFVRGDLLGPLEGREACVDLVVSNPPYISHEECPDLAPEVRDFEPAMALFADQRGLALIERLLPAAARVLTADGTLLVEHGWQQGEAVRALAQPCFAEVTTLPDLQGHPRALQARRPKR